MFYFRDPDTGYYDPDEESLAQHEAAEERAYLEELEASYGCEFDERRGPHDVDPETGCTPAEMREEEIVCGSAFNREMERTMDEYNNAAMFANRKVA